MRRLLLFAMLAACGKVDATEDVVAPGDKGDTGEQGAQGAKGPTGERGIGYAPDQ